MSGLPDELLEQVLEDERAAAVEEFRHAKRSRPMRPSWPTCDRQARHELDDTRHRVRLSST
jgi:hypothetical protein